MKNISGILLAFFLFNNVFAQVVVTNYNFNSTTGYPVSASASIAGINSYVNSNQVYGTATGTATGTSAFATNSNTSPGALIMTNSSGTNTKWWEFGVSGSAVLNNLTTFKIYLQAYRTGTGAQTLTCAYSTDSLTFTNLPTTGAPGNTVYNEIIFDLSAIAALNNPNKLFFRIMASGASGSGSVRLDNLQLQAVCPSVSEPTINASSFVATNVLCDNLKLNLTGGNGNKRLIVGRKGSPVTAVPVDGVAYNANTAFGAGTAIAANQFVLSSDTVTQITVSNLNQSSTYYFKVFEYNGSIICPGTINYFPSGAAPSINATTGNCLQIQSILVHACGAPESNNEMFRFKTGVQALNISDLEVGGRGNTGAFGWDQWPNVALPFNNFCQNANTQNKVDSLNLTILSCGHLLQPPGGIIPPNATVIAVASQYMDVSANSFSNLQDTIYMIFQCFSSNPSQGCFVNSNNAGAAVAIPSGTNSFRTLGLRLLSSGNADTVTYNANLLINSNTNGLIYGGNAALNRGATVLYDDPGNASYVNFQCHAPFLTFTTNPVTHSVTHSLVICSLDTVVVKANPNSNSYNNVIWSTNGGGTLLSQHADSILYIPVIADSNGVEFYFSISDVCNNIYLDTISAIFNKPPTGFIAASGPLTFCTGNSVTLTANNPSGANLLWNTGDLTNAITVSTSGTYTVTLSNVCGSKVMSKIVTVKSFPVADAGRDTAICSGSNLNIGTPSTLNYTYSWDHAAELNNNSVSNPSVLYINSDTLIYSHTYTVATTLNGCTTLDSVTVTFNPVPAHSATQSLTVCPGEPASIGATTQINGYTYSWLPTTNVAAPDSAQTTVLAPSGTSQYILTTIGIGGCINTDTTNVTGTISLIVDAGTNDSVCLGSGTQLHAVSGATGYSWTPTTGLSNALISNPIATPSITTTYYVLATSGNCTATDSVMIFVNTPVIPVISNLSSLSFCAGDSVMIVSNTLTGNVWSVGGINDTIIVNVAGPIFSTVTDINGCNAVSNVLNVFVNTYPTQHSTQNFTICPGGNVNIGIPQLTTGFNYLWTPADSLNDSTIVPAIANPSGNMQYLLTVTATGNCSITDTVNVIISNSIAVVASNDTAICGGNSASLNATGSTTNYLWTPSTGLSNPAIANPTANPLITTTYTVTASSGTCSATDSVIITVNDPVQPTISASGPTTFCTGGSVTLTSSATSGNTWSNASINNSINVSANGTFTVTVIDINGCNATSNPTVVTVNSIPNASAGNPVNFCSGGNANIGTSTSGNFYLWTPSTGLNNPNIANPSVTGINTGTTPIVQQYNLTVSNGSCSNTDSVLVTINPLPSVDAGIDVTVCSGVSANIGSAGTGGIIYSWSPVSDLSGSTTSLTSFTSTNAGPTPLTFVYTLTATNPATSCSNADQVNVTVNPLPTIGITNNSVNTICSGNAVTLTALTNSSAIVTWSNLQTGNFISVTNAGIYTASVTDLCGTATSNSITINIDSVNAAFTASTLTGDAPLSVGFTNTSTVNQSYSWVFGNTGTSILYSPADETYNVGGIYSVVLTVTTVLGCVDTASVIITVKELPLVFEMPNVFTPNGDNINDFLKLHSDSLAEFEIKIYDRWGLFMFESKDYKIGWDGRTQGGSAAADGVYYYIVNYRFVKRTDAEKKEGSFSLMR